MCNVVTTVGSIFIFYCIFFILAGNKDTHTSLDQFEFLAVQNRTEHNFIENYASQVA